jgi:hypothetical protein
VHPAALEVAALGMVAGMFACESHLESHLHFCSGTTSEHCGAGCQVGYGTCGPKKGSGVSRKVSIDGTCGGSRGQTCFQSVFGNCCSWEGVGQPLLVPELNTNLYFLVISIVAVQSFTAGVVVNLHLVHAATRLCHLGRPRL